MRDELAERLLTTVMEWSPADIARERPLLQAMAAFKYDGYEGFAPGMRFVGSLALWLGQMDTIDERRIAFAFLRDRLLFVSGEEMRHLVTCAYSDHIRKHLIRSAALLTGLNPRLIGRIVRSVEFRRLQRQTLFLGLSDGARIDAFRRINASVLSHEQIYQTYELTENRATNMLQKLREDIGKGDGHRPDGAGEKFRVIVLLDDFAGSGRSYVLRNSDHYEGKLAKFHSDVCDDPSVGQLFDIPTTLILVVLYCATEAARKHIEHGMAELWGPSGASSAVEVIYPLDESIRVQRDSSEPVTALANKYYDAAIFDEHLSKGGTLDAKFGFADCGLPLVLSHNTPNNSIALLWSYDETQVRGLFPRVQRHRVRD